MSIYASETVAGADEDDNYDGTVISYIEGWSNHYPHQFPDGDGAETPAAIWTGWIAPFCVPGNLELSETPVDTDTHVGPWMRLDVCMQTASVWNGPLEIGPRNVHSVLLDESAVLKLRDNLNAWLDRTKVHPK